jgi:hypothetical protein
METRKIVTEHTLFNHAVGRHNAGDRLTIFRAPTIMDGSGHKRMPHEIDWEHVQVGDSLIAISIWERESGLRTLERLSLLDVVGKADEQTFEVYVNDIVPLGFDGKVIYDRIAALLGKPEAEDLSSDGGNE